MEDTTERIVWASQEPGEAGYLTFDWAALARSLGGTICMAADEAYSVRDLLVGLGYDLTMEVAGVELTDQIASATAAALWVDAWDLLKMEVRDR